MVKDAYIDYKETGRTIQWFRERKGLTRTYVADVIGTHHQVVSSWELGQYLPSLGNAIRLADLFGVSVEDFVIQRMECEAYDSMAKEDAI